MLGKTHLMGGLACGMVVERSLAVVRALNLTRLPDANLEQVMAPMKGQAVVEMGSLMLPTIIVIYSAVSLGSLLPDIDEPKSLVSNLPRIVGKRIGRSVGRQGRGLIDLLFWPINGLTQLLSTVVRIGALGHRGATHWAATALVIGLLLSGLGWLIGFPALGFWLFLGYASHLTLDMMTLSGLAVWQPFSRRKYHLLPKLMRVRTGSPIDSLIGISTFSFAATYAAITYLIPVFVLAQKMDGRAG